MIITDATQQRLLDAAELVFAERGFKAASVREICKRARANIAAVNYYFGDKERLYIETVKYAHQACIAGLPMPDWGPDVPPVQKLRDFIQVMVLRMLRPQRPASLQLMMRELAAPTEACAVWVQEYIRPMAETLREILRDLLPGRSLPQLYLTGFSIVGQCLFYRQNRAVIGLLLGEGEFEQLEVEQVVEHVTRFTLQGLGLPVGTSHPVREGI